MIGNGKGRSCFVAHKIGGGIQNRGRSRKSEVEVGCEVEVLEGGASLIGQAEGREIAGNKAQQGSREE